MPMSRAHVRRVLSMSPEMLPVDSDDAAMIEAMRDMHGYDGDESDDD
jgi:hypothetical protein